MEWTEPAYAKINLTLDILGKLPNGYHSLSMVMQSVSLHDDVTLRMEPENPGIRVDCGEAAPSGPDNIVWKAARAFFDSCGISAYGVSFTVTKRTPSQAGMGGGSSDAAAALRLLNRAFQTRLTARELRALGARIGADVPFCITGGTMKAEGIGERLTPAAPLPRCSILLCKPPIGVSTPQAFRQADSSPAAPEKTPAMLRALETGRLEMVAGCLGNRFQEILHIPEIREITTGMKQLGALGACMTGSGSVVFGLFRQEEEARDAGEKIRRMGDTWVVSPMGEMSL